MRMAALLPLAAAVTLASAGGPALAAGDAAAGQQIFKKVCTTCHSIEPGVNKTGPSLDGVYGRKAGSYDFPRYKGLVGADFTWNSENLFEYLANPKAFVIAHTANKTTAMTFSLKDEQQREDVIAYLKQESEKK